MQDSKNDCASPHHVKQSEPNDYFMSLKNFVKTLKTASFKCTGKLKNSKISIYIVCYILKQKH